jgi:hypothetical protein
VQKKINQNKLGLVKGEEEDCNYIENPEYEWTKGSHQYLSIFTEFFEITDNLKKW